MSDRSIRSLLEQAADGAGEEFRAPTVEEFRQRRTSRRRNTIAVAASVAVVVLVAAISVAVTRRAAPAPTGDHHALPSAGHVTAAQLSHYRWSTLPTAPIAARSEAASVWTGTQMLVWGGVGNGRHYMNGAAYTPSTRTWRMIPPAPLAARAEPFAMWTGTDMIVWGGERLGHQFDDGAVYDPVTRRWAKMAAAPESSGFGEDLVWAGSYAIRLSLDKQFAATTVQADAFDPSTNRWSSLPSITFPPVNNYTGVSAALVSGRLVVWVSDGHSYVLNASRSSWTPVPYSPGIAGCIYDEIPAGGDVVFPASLSSRSCGGDVPAVPGTRGAEFDRATGRARHIAYTVTSDAGCTTVWTGGALLNADADEFQGSLEYERKTLHSEAGTSAAWDPAANAWTPVSTAPVIDHSATWVWTGTELIGWGRFGSTHPGTSAPSGVAFAP